MRWHSMLQEYPIQFTHISGHKDGALDLLSRMAHFVPSVAPQLTLIPDSLVDRERGGGGEEPQFLFRFHKNRANRAETKKNTHV